MSSITGSQCRKKGQVFAADALVAALIALFILYIGFSEVASMSVRAAEAEANAASEGRVIAFADYLMKEGLVHKGRSDFGNVSYSHVLEMARLEGAQREGFDAEIGGACAPQQGRVCVCRPAIIFESREVGFLEVCGK